MTSSALAHDIIAATADAANDDSALRSLNQRLAEEVADMEPVVTAAVLACAAFRLRDETSLITALRHLTDAVSALEQARAEG